MHRYFLAILILLVSVRILNAQTSHKALTRISYNINVDTMLMLLSSDPKVSEQWAMLNGWRYSGIVDSVGQNPEASALTYKVDCTNSNGKEMCNHILALMSIGNSLESIVYFGGSTETLRMMNEQLTADGFELAKTRNDNEESVKFYGNNDYVFEISEKVDGGSIMYTVYRRKKE